MSRILDTDGIPDSWDDVECPDCGSGDVDNDLVCGACGADVDELLTDRL